MERRKIALLKSPTLRRKSKPTPLTERVTLERVLGLTCTSNASLACDPHTGTIAYPAGCVVVLLKKNKQTHLFNASKKTITSVAFSGDGKHLVTGECGHQPAVRVWDLAEKTQVGQFQGHKFGINCVAFSPNLKYIVSIGTQHDMMVNVWNWKTNTKVASNKVATKVTDIAFSEDGSSFVTVGNRHVKFWYLDASKSRHKEVVPLMGRSGILGEQRNNFFCGVSCGKGDMSGSVYCITQSGLLCEFNDKRLLDKWVELRTTGANSINVGRDYIFIGCADGIVRIFDPRTLHYVATLPRPHCLGVDVAAGLDPSHMVSHTGDAKHPDTIAVVLDDVNKKVVCIYNDHSLYIWDVRDVKKVGKSRSYLYHSAAIWGLEVYPPIEESQRPALPPGSFITCSSDDTIRVWNLDAHMSSDYMLKRNIYSNELLKTVYIDPGLSNICDVDFNPAGKTDKTDTTYTDKNGVRCIKVSPDGQHLASGDRMGNIRIHDLHFMTDVGLLEAHDSEVLCLEYTRPETGVRLLASASRDRLIHVFDIQQDYGLVQTLDDHSAAITSVRFINQDAQLQMLSCGADKSLLFRTAQIDPEFQFQLNRHLVGKNTLYDMDVDATSKFVATGCQDRNVRIYNIKNGKQKKCYKGSLGDDGTIIRVQLDPSGLYVGTSCSDKNLYLYDFFSGECMGSMFGHSEIPTGLKFANDLKHVISVGGDGCIFVWRLPLDMTQHMQNRLADLGQQMPSQISLSFDSDIRRETYLLQGDQASVTSSVDDRDNDNLDFPIVQGRTWPRMSKKGDEIDKNANSEPDPDYRFSVGQLPTWAKKQIVPKDPNDSVPNETLPEVLQEPFAKPPSNLANPVIPKGRWAQNVDSQGLNIKSMLDNNSAIQLSLADCMDRRRFTVEQESLVEQIKNLRRETVVLSKTENKNIPIITDDENNQDDDDDDEFCSIREQVEKRLDDDAGLLNQSGGGVTMSRGSDGWTRGNPLLLKGMEEEEEGEDVEGDTTEMVYYLPNEDGSESSETIASSYQVFDLKSVCGKSSVTDETSDTLSNKDGGSEGTDPFESEDEDAKTPSTPSDPTKTFLDDAISPEKEQFLKKNFENLGEEPDTFGHNLDSLEQQMNSGNPPPHIFQHRSSISSRFLSRSQQAHLSRTFAGLGDNRTPSSSIAQQRKQEMNKAMADARKRLQALGFHKQSESEGDPDRPERDAESPSWASSPSQNKDLPSPPTKLSEKDNCTEPKTPTKTKRSLPDEKSARFAVKSILVASKSSSGSKYPSSGSNLESGRKWKSMFDVSGRSRSKSPFPSNERSKSQSERSQTPGPTPSRYVTTAEVKLSPNKNIPQTNSRAQSKERNGDPFGRSPPRSKSEFSVKSAVENGDNKTSNKRRSLQRQHSYQAATKSSLQKVNHAGSNTSLNKAENGTSGSPRKSMGRRGRLSNMSKTKFKSTPDLSSAQDDDDLEASPDFLTSSKTMEDMQVFPKNSVTKKDLDSKKADTLPRRSVAFEVSRALGLKDMDTTSGHGDNGEDVDREAMPPPASNVPLAKSKQDAFLKKAMKNKRKTMPDLTLSQAKDILLGKSKLLGSKPDSDSSRASSIERPDSALSLPGNMDLEDEDPTEASSTSPKGAINLSSSVPNGHELDASPIELPVKDQSPMKDPIRKTRVEITDFRPGMDSVARGRRSPMPTEGGPYVRRSSRFRYEVTQGEPDIIDTGSQESNSPTQVKLEKTIVRKDSIEIRKRSTQFSKRADGGRTPDFSTDTSAKSSVERASLHSEKNATTGQNTAGSSPRSDNSLSSSGNFDSPKDSPRSRWDNHPTGSKVVKRDTVSLSREITVTQDRSDLSHSDRAQSQPARPLSPSKRYVSPLRKEATPVRRGQGLTLPTPPTSLAGNTSPRPSLSSSVPGNVSPRPSFSTSSPHGRRSSAERRRRPSAEQLTKTEEDEVLSQPDQVKKLVEMFGGLDKSLELKPAEKKPGEREAEAEIQRPDKSRSFPPTSLNTTLPTEMDKSSVVLTSPSPPDSLSPRPDRTKLMLQLDNTATSPPAVPHVDEPDECAQAVSEFKLALMKATQLHKKMTEKVEPGKSSEKLQLLSETFLEAQGMLGNILGQQRETASKSVNTDLDIEQLQHGCMAKGQAKASGIVASDDMQQLLMNNLQPLLQQHCSQLTGTVCQVIKNKIDKS